jgi:AbrB family looped-hinge helix DNA binding protein
VPREMASQPTRANAARLRSVTAKGQMTIPADIRRKAGIEAGDKLLFSIKNGKITVEKTGASRQIVDDAWNAGQSAMMGEWNHPDEDAYND